MIIYLCLSSHGYGHAARQAAILSEINRLKPKWRLVVSSVIDLDFLNLMLIGIPFETRRVRWDIGIRQGNAFDLDLDETLNDLQKLEESLPGIIDSEVNWIKSQKEATIVLGDIPPAAARLASLIGSPLIWMGNFGWDDIYRPLGRDFLRYAEDCSASYATGNFLIRFPFSLAMNWGLNELEVGLTPSILRPLSVNCLKKITAFPGPKVIVGFGGFGFKLSLLNSTTEEGLWLEITHFLQYITSVDNFIILPYTNYD